MEICKKSRLLSDERLLKTVTWPVELTVKEIRKLIANTTRFIDFDNTLVTYVTYSQNNELKLREVFCERLIREFLAEKPFIIQTWHLGRTPECLFVPELRDKYKIIYASILTIKALPRPVLICRPPAVWLDKSSFFNQEIDEYEDSHLCKDLSAIGIRAGSEVYDDRAHAVYAPGCKMISKF